MCGIVGYVGFRSVSELLLEGLHRLEYRGYDSAGIAVMADDGIVLRKRAGRVGELAALLDEQPVRGSIGIGHTRWATHGETTDENSHPHIGGNGEVAIVHNGVIENYISLRNQLQEMGYVFQSQTDTEVVAHLIAHHLSEQQKLNCDEPCMRTCLRAINLSLDQLKGTFGLCVLFRDCPETVIAARAGSPLVIGIGKDEYFLASDASPLIGYTKEVVYLADNEVVVLQPSGIQITHR
ncbi:MAG TPA: glutamine--fructose-6-phosphate aminotransferase, partial [Planctomycetes bacterium]|nr:glutamine--fructose-6-phosphate aminotransferase [Planctomycetota bacterium]